MTRADNRNMTHIYNASRVELSCVCGRGAGYCCARCGKVVCGSFCPAFCNRYDDGPGSRPTLDQVDGIMLISCYEAPEDNDCGIDETIEATASRLTTPDARHAIPIPCNI